MTPTPQEINPLIPSPPFDKYRPHQWDATLEVMGALEGGAKVVLVHANTGSGKTLLAESVRSMYAGQWESTPYLCTTKTLQDQILSDLPYAKVLKGRANYPTRYFDSAFPGISCDDCDPIPERINEDNPPEDLLEDIITYGIHAVTRQDGQGDTWATKCNNCGVQPLCPYIKARDTAVNAPLCVTNTAYYLREANGPGRLSGRKLVIVDEADAFEDVILDTFTVSVPQWLLDDPSCPKPRTASNPEDIDAWISTMIPFLDARLSDLERNKRSWIEKWGAKKQRGRANTVSSLLTNLSLANAETWLYDGPSDRSRKRYFKAVLRPTWVEDWVQEFVWDHADQWILMSASFVSMDLTAKNLGLKKSQIAKVNVDYAFPPERRPIRYWPSRKPYTQGVEKEGFDVIGDIARKVECIVDWWPDERVLIHTQSHARTEALVERLNPILTDRPMFSFTTGVARDNAIDLYRTTPGAVLLGAGLERGYDFRGDECRVCIVVKAPFPGLGDPVVAARARAGQIGDLWYNLATVRSFTQSVGRGMRSEDDWLVTYALDASFEKYLSGAYKKLMPKDVLDAVRFGVPMQREEVVT